MLEFLRVTGGLKTLPRQGWVDRRISAPESVADHMYRSAMMAWVLGVAAGLDTDRLVKLVLVHDLPEALVGDATPYMGILSVGTEIDRAVAHWRELMSAEEVAAARDRKHAAEARGLTELCDLLPPIVAEELTELWTDYAELRTPEARFASQIDKLEALLQAVEYQEAGQPADVQNFLVSARESVEHPVLRALLAELEASIPCER